MHRTTRAAGRRRPGLLLATAALLAVTATACGNGGDGDGAEPTGVADVHTTTDSTSGTVLDRPFTKPDLVLTDHTGERFDLREETKGHPTLIYFGYTHCPDVCPLTMSNLALAKKQLPPADQKKLRVVFITSDPERDTPASLRAWLRGQDPDFIGLTGDFDTIAAAARSLGVSLEPPEVDEDGDVVSSHGTQVLAFSPKDDRAHVVYSKDVSAETYARDLPTLIRGEIP